MLRTPLALLAGALTLAACGDSAPAATDAAVVGDPVDGARTIEVVADDFAFDPDALTVEAGEDVTIALTSVDIVHDLTVDELGYQVVARRGDTEELGLRATEPGTYTYYCSIPGHRSAGMEGTLTVE
ncbi:MAG: cupredoxin domain-containing protein [Acidimicrobiia bacterium]